MTREEHIERHKLLHRQLDELVADMIQHTDMRPSKNTIMELIEWSHGQTIDPTEPKP